MAGAREAGGVGRKRGMSRVAQKTVMEPNPLLTGPLSHEAVCFQHFSVPEIVRLEWEAPQAAGMSTSQGTQEVPLPRRMLVAREAARPMVVREGLVVLDLKMDREEERRAAVAEETAALEFIPLRQDGLLHQSNLTPVVALEAMQGRRMLLVHFPPDQQ